MNFINGAKLRRLIPAGAIGVVLAFSYLAPLPSDASNGVGGFGYNCGVKGYGYHDHGKPCPNRPFPGKGEGIEKFISNGSATLTGSGGATSNGGTTSPGHSNTTTEDEGNTTADVDSNTLSTSHGRGHGKGHGRGKGHSNL